jgi:hypothetical protein
MEIDPMRTFTACQLTGCLFLALLLAGCASAPPEKTEFMERAGTDLTKRQLETLMYRYGMHYAGQVELAAYEIYEDSKDREIRNNAIIWNTICVPQMMSSCFNHEPMVGLAQAWIYAGQVREYFEEGRGKDYFGPYQDRVVAVSRSLETDIHDIVFGILPEAVADTFEQRRDEWLVQYPINNDRFVTEGITPTMIRAMGTEVPGGLGAAGSMNQQMVAMTDRANLLTAYMPRQLQWQTASVLAQSQEMIADVTDSTIARLNREAGATIGPLLAFLDEQRRLATADMASERAAVLSALVLERTAVLTHLEVQRSEVFKEISNERNELLKNMNEFSLAMLQQTVLESQEMAEASIDRVYWRTVNLMVLPFLALIVFLIIVMVWIRNTTNRIFAVRAGQDNMQR